MRRSWTHRLLGVFQLTRLPMAFGAVSDAWLTVLITRADDRYAYVPAARMELWVALALAAAIACGLFSFAASLNDLLDARRDGALSPDRPIPAGRLQTSHAVALVMSSFLVAVLAALPLGTGAVVLTIACALGLVFYDAAAKFVPAVGILLLGLVHAMHMLVPNHDLTFTLPAWLTMSHAIAIAIGVYLLEQKRPALSTRSMVTIGVGWVALSTLLIGAGLWQATSEGYWPGTTSPWRILWPLLAVAGFVVVSRIKLASAKPGDGAEKIKRYGAMWQSLYAAAWLLATGLVTEALWMGGLAVTGFLVMTIAREVGGLVIAPPRWRV